MRNLRTISLSLAALVLLGLTAVVAPQSLAAQSAKAAALITEPVNEGQLVTLKGNTHPAANSKNDRGQVSPDLRMSDLILVLSRGAQQQAAFDAFVNSQYDQNSPNFHRWLTPDQVGAQYGASTEDIATISGWLASHGFTVDEVSKDRLEIRFSGTAAQVQSAFHTEIHNLLVNGKPHIANMSDPRIPAALAPAIVGVKALHNFFPRPAHHMGSNVTRDASSGKWERLSTPVATGSTSATPALANRSFAAPRTAAKTSPQYGISVGGSAPYLVEDVDPWDFATIYNILPLWNNSTKAIDGAGQTIAIAGTSDIDVGQTAGSESLNAGSGANGLNDVATFRTAFGLPTSNAANTPIRVSGNSEPLTVCTDPTEDTYPSPDNPCGIDDLTENTLDVEWSASIAKNAQVVLVSSYPASPTDDNLYDSESYIVNNVGNSASPVYGVHIMNVSYGECELSNGTAGNVEYYDLWQQAAAEGISVFVAAGDSGSASCDDGDSWAASGLTVSGLASTPWNTAVGGTDFNWCNPDTANGTATTECTAAPYWSTSAYASTGSTAQVTTAQGYVPEVPWNESCANPLTLKWSEDIANSFLPSYGYSGSQVSNVEQACNFLLDFDFTEDQYGDYGLLYYGYPYSYITYLLETVGGSGGASNCVVGNAVTNPDTGEISGCSAAATSTGNTTNPDTGALQSSLSLSNDGWPKPSWQTGVTGIPADGVRDLPDVSFFASDGYVSSSAYLICVSAANSNQACSYSTYTEPFYQEVGGTSVATPAMAGVMALINQKTGAAQGFASPELYRLAATESYGSCSAQSVTASSTSCVFNDITEETNAMPCDAADGTPNCTASSSTLGYSDAANGLGILTGYSATTGFDLATGLGSLNVSNVVDAWPASTGTAAAAVTVTPDVSTLNASDVAIVTVTVAGGAGAPETSLSQAVVPTGSVTLTASGSTYTATGSLSTGTYVFVVPAGSLAGSSGGQTDTLTATYSGDAVYAANTGSNTVNVSTATELTPTVTVTPSATTLTSAMTLGVTVAVSGSGGTPTGYVYIASGSYTSATVAIGSTGCTAASCSFTIPAGVLSSGSDTITAYYTGNTVYSANTGTTTATVTTATFSLSQTAIAVNPATIAPGATATATITISAIAGYSGTAVLTCTQTSTTATGGDGAGCTVTSTPQAMGSTVTATVSTTAPEAADLEYRNLPGGKGKGWLGAGSGAVLALLLFLGVPARRRTWQSMLGILVLMTALGSLAGCGGGASTSGSGGTADPGTTAGVYTFTVQATGNPTVASPVSTTFTVTVN